VKKKGPTHDDITYESIAAAYGLEMKVDKETYDYIEQQLKKRNPDTMMTKHHARMAIFPSPALLLREIKHIRIPIVVVNENIYILPGIPSLFKLLLDSLQPRFSKSSSQFYRTELATAEPEVAIADILSKAQLEANPYQIKIGSYPVWSSSDQTKVIVTVSGRDQSKVNDLSQSIMQKVKGWPYLKSQL
jgi:molybdopterin-biosynthesis enzyme MoeA-like protein